MTPEVVHLVPYPPAVRTEYLGLHVVALHYEDGTVRVQHPCRTIDYGDGVVHRLVTAPALRLGDGHVLVQADPVTVTPSVLCPDCGLHGYITAGRWIAC